MNEPEYQYSSAMEGLREIYQREGLLRFYRSTRIYLGAKTLYTALQFQSYEMLNFFYHSNLALVLNPVASAIIATTLMNPLEVLITHYAMVDTTQKALVFKHIVRRLWQQEGIRGFYNGFTTEVTLHSIYALLWIPVFQYMRDQYGVNLSD